MGLTSSGDRRKTPSCGVLGRDSRSTCFSRTWALNRVSVVQLILRELRGMRGQQV